MSQEHEHNLFFINAVTLLQQNPLTVTLIKNQLVNISIFFASSSNTDFIFQVSFFFRIGHYSRSLEF
jgi:hypothetical protein